MNPQMPIFIDFDDIENWFPLLTDILQPHISELVRIKLREAAPEYVEDALDILYGLTNRQKIIDCVIEWINSGYLIAYHGTRLIEEERECIKKEGLQPLLATSRREKLIEKLSRHPRWNEVSHRLDSVIDSLGPNTIGGRREGQVHATLSRSGLVNCFNHYLTYGSEFDQCVATYLFDSRQGEVLSEYGEPTLIQLAIPGKEALRAAHPFSDIDDMRQMGNDPSIVREFIEAWSYRLAYGNFESSSLQADCGMMFYSPVVNGGVKLGH